MFTRSREFIEVNFGNECKNKESNNIQDICLVFALKMRQDFEELITVYTPEEVILKIKATQNNIIENSNKIKQNSMIHTIEVDGSDIYTAYRQSIKIMLENDINEIIIQIYTIYKQSKSLIEFKNKYQKYIADRIENFNTMEKNSVLEILEDIYNKLNIVEIIDTDTLHKIIKTSYKIVEGIIHSSAKNYEYGAITLEYKNKVDKAVMKIAGITSILIENDSPKEILDIKNSCKNRLGEYVINNMK